MRLSVIQKINGQLPGLCESYQVFPITDITDDDLFDPHFSISLRHNGEQFIYVCMIPANQQKAKIYNVTFVFDIKGEFTNQAFNYGWNESSGELETKHLKRVNSNGK